MKRIEKVLSSYHKTNACGHNCVWCGHIVVDWDWFKKPKYFCGITKKRVTKKYICSQYFLEDGMGEADE